MRFESLCLSVVCLIAVVVLIADLTLAKSVEKKPPKKASSAKPTKGPKSLTDHFTHLSIDDIAFIKALDKQFSKYGVGLKIKVVNGSDSAAAVTAKHKKRTVNGDIGYGYHGPQQPEEHYSFSKPKFVIYPYSQHDIPPLPSYQMQQQHQHQYYTTHEQQYQPQTQALQVQPNNRYLPVEKEPVYTHSVQIQPSVSIELKHNGQGYEPVQPNHGGGSYYQPQQHQQPQRQEESSVPVIVLRIPGPQKYAAHLQQLLQEYLEVRAAEYIKLLQEEEYQQQQQQHHQQQQPQQYQQPQHQEEQSQQQYQQNYSQDSDAPQEQPEQHTQQGYHQQTEEQKYIAYQPQGMQQEQEADETDAPQQDIYSQQQYQHQPMQQYGPPAAQHAEEHQSPSMPVQENYPSPLHTQVIFTGHGNYASQMMARILQAKGYEGYQHQPQSEEYPVAAVKYVKTLQQTSVTPAEYYGQPEQVAQSQAHQHSEPQRQFVYQYRQQHHQPAEEEEGSQNQQEDEDETPADYEHQSSSVSITQRSVDATVEQYTHSPHERPHNYHAHGRHPVSPAKMSRY